MIIHSHQAHDYEELKREINKTFATSRAFLCAAFFIFLYALLSFVLGCVDICRATLNLIIGLSTSFYALLCILRLLCVMAQDWLIVRGARC